MVRVFGGRGRPLRRLVWFGLPLGIVAFQVPQVLTSLGSIRGEECEALMAIAPPSSPLPEPVREAIAPLMASYLSAPEHPTIHGQGRLSRIPILMYHDILPEKEVFFDVTPDEFEAVLQEIERQGITPISLDQLVLHLQTGMPLPEKPILLSFDDGYAGHYEHVFPLLQEYGYPGVFGIYPSKVGKNFGRSSLTWEQLREMAHDPLITIASHSLNHPNDLRELDDTELQDEVVESKQILEAELGIPIHHFVYPVGHYDERVKAAVQEAGYVSALTMDDDVNKLVGESEDLLSLERIGQSQWEMALEMADGGPTLNLEGTGFNFMQPVEKVVRQFDDTELVLISGGEPRTIHADSRYQVPEIIADTEAIAAVDGGFFSLKYLDSNVMIGPVLSQSTGEFVPGNPSENPLLNGRPLVLIGDSRVEFVPFDADRHNTLAGIQAEMPDVTDAFVGAAWLVKDGEGRSRYSFGNLFDFDANRHRAFWGIDFAGRPVVGVSRSRIDSIRLGQMLAQAGLREAVMLDSGASTSLAYEGESLVRYIPRPVPHVVALFPPLEPAAIHSTVARTPQLSAVSSTPIKSTDTASVECVAALPDFLQGWQRWGNWR